MSKNLDFKAYNAFNLSHEHKFTCDMGELIPCLCREVVPGDIWRVNAKIFSRLIPQIAPFMHEVDMFAHFFFVPNRLVNPDWEEFITKGFSGTSVIPWTYVEAPSGGFTKYSVYDYLRLPLGVAGIQVDAMPIRGYYLICNEWYTNENVQTYTTIGTSTGQDTTTPGTIMKRNWQNDYFTGALPWAQRGSPVYLPLGVTADIKRKSNASGWRVFDSGTDTLSGDSSGSGLKGAYVNSNGNLANNLSGGNKVVSLDPKGGLYADLSTATAATINDIRVAFQVQRWMEKNARGGVRYIEFLLSHFGEKSSDERLQRPEYLGGGKSYFVTSEVLQTSSTDSTSPQGNMAGHSFSGQKTMSFTRRFEEFGWVYCIFSVMPRTQYQQGIERQWSRKTPLDYYFPSFAHLGQQEILNKELYAQGTSADDGVFGFQDRFEELRTIPNGVSGDFRDTLDYWTMTRKFNALPQLNSTFVEADPTKRIFAVQNAKTCLVDIGFDIQCLRKVPKHGTPGLLDHA